MTKQGTSMNDSTTNQKHIVVIGAGIVGIGTAIWLLRDGHRVTLVDAKGPAEGTSYGNAGILASSSIVPVTTPGSGRESARNAVQSRWRFVFEVASTCRACCPGCAVTCRIAPSKMSSGSQPD